MKYYDTNVTYKINDTFYQERVKLNALDFIDAAAKAIKLVKQNTPEATDCIVDLIMVTTL